jgi:hypothetical protein
VRAAVVVLLGLLAACCAPTSPAAPAAAERVAPTAEYRAWWAHVDSCSGIHKSIDAVQFYLVDSLPAPVTARTVDHARIYVARFYAHSAVVVQHEMVHARGIDGHPAEYFRRRCGDLLQDGGT